MREEEGGREERGREERGRKGGREGREREGEGREGGEREEEREGEREREAGRRQERRKKERTQSQQCANAYMCTYYLHVCTHSVLYSKWLPGMRFTSHLSGENKNYCTTCTCQLSCKCTMHILPALIKLSLER